MISIFQTTYKDYGQKIRYVRHKVFVEGQNVPEDLEIDGKDDSCFHILLTKNDEAIGTGRMEMDGHIGRIAVLEEYRGMNFGSMIMNKLEEIAAKNGIKRTYLNSQVQAVSFYLKLGYEPVGDYFMEAGIEHRKMIKELQR
ncbi:MAG: GNAT family N-acetyltransferase [Candidatus Delongbacteria bacterium]|jgi:predicted GNAT family N-acyltransferase|nr:GNAT family N-acetyltransferase [Candidatus Delongbacteria bacterium]MDD4205222.1 GNAT family N-acetyltransferase [Candidatus Delongbacteria bacterium]MDY0016999.1 GNAT family N-acetyltransferase [Candidatus Delongbacteria bacterium]